MEHYIEVSSRFSSLTLLGTIDILLSLFLGGSSFSYYGSITRELDYSREYRDGEDSEMEW